MHRRTFVAAAAAVSTLAAPRVARSQAAKVLRFIPQVDVSILDPVTTTAYIARNHGFAVFDTLFGQDSTFAAQPQMVGGVVTEADGKLWRLTPAGRADVPRRHAGAGAGLRGEHPAVGEAGRVRAGAAGGDGRAFGGWTTR